MTPAALRAVLHGAVFDALHGARLEIDGSGVAQLVNSANTRDLRR